MYIGAMHEFSKADGELFCRDMIREPCSLSLDVAVIRDLHPGGLLSNLVEVGSRSRVVRLSNDGRNEHIIS